MIASHTYHLAVAAGAGTGKTYSLVENYLCALLGLDPSGIKKRPEHILALTFTQKAAQEMRVRVAKRLNGLLLKEGEHDPLIALYKEHYHEVLSYDEIKRLLRALPNAPISTFHGFCRDVLLNTKTLSSKEQFDLFLPHEEKNLAQNILRPLILDRIKKPDAVMRSLVARFRLSSNPASLGLIDALLLCYTKLFESGVDIKALSKPERAFKLNNDIERIKDALLLFTDRNPKISARLNIVEESIENLLGSFSSEALFIKHFLDLKDAVKGNFGPTQARRSLVDAVRILGVHAVDYFLQDDAFALSLLLNDFHQEFTKAKLDAGKLSYNDLLAKVRDRLCLDLDFRKALKQRFLHILIDEYQDTSPVQEEIISYLCENKNEEQHLNPGSSALMACDFNSGSSLFVVGDKKQSIYGFRGADTMLFDRMINKMASTTDNFKRRLLTINRRSAPRIIKLVNLVSHATLLEQGYETHEDLEPHEDVFGTAELWLNADDRDLDKTSANLACTAFGIEKLLLSRPDLKPRDIVVLVRRSRSGSVIKQHLSKLGIPARVMGGEGFFQEQAIVDIISALKLINDPHHELASAIVLRSPLLLFLDQEFFSVHLSESGISYKKALEAEQKGALSEETSARLIKFQSILSRIKNEVPERGLAWAVDLLITEFDLAYWWGLQEESQQTWANINKLRTMLVSVYKNPFQVIEEYFHNIFHNHQEAQASGESLSDFVTIMTIHQSKGLEWKVVVVADGESALPPQGADILTTPQFGLVVRPKNRLIKKAVPESTDASILTTFQKASLEIRQREKKEMARLLYVALTRAKTDLYVVSSQASFLEREQPKSLLGLFLLAYHQKPEEFLELCEIKEITFSSVPHEKKMLLPTKPENLLVYEHKSATKRVFSSSLKAPDNFGYASFINRRVGKTAKNIDGSLAHQILADAGAILKGFDAADHTFIAHVIDAALRSKSPYEDENKAQITKEACQKTLAMLHGSLLLASRVIFEKAILCWPNKELLIEGFADLVLEFDDFVGVIEFKSSAKLAKHPDTYMQMFAYAHGLEAQSKKPIKCAAILVGSSAPIYWHSYEKARGAFLDALETPSN